MNKIQQYLFDLQGYIIIQNAINKDKVSELNSIIDTQDLPKPGFKTIDARFGENGSCFENDSSSGFLDWGKSFCDL